MNIDKLKALSNVSTNYTGYTHQYKTKSMALYSQYLMASTHNKTQSIEATKKGYRFFEVINKQDSPSSNTVNCPASKESNKKASCITCGLCSGLKSKAKSINILAH